METVLAESLHSQNALTYGGFVIREEDGGSVGQRVRQIREQLGLTQQELAEAAGLSQSQIAQLEQGRITRPQRPTTRAIAGALGISYEWLRRGWGEPFSRPDVKPEHVPLYVYIRDAEELSDGDKDIMLALYRRLTGTEDETGVSQEQ